MLVQARAKGTPLRQLPEEVRPTTLDEAYAVQREGWSATLAQYDTRRIGYKVAATSEMAQKSVAMTHPFAGALFSHSTFGYDPTIDATNRGADSFHRRRPRTAVARASSGEGEEDRGSSRVAAHRTVRLSAAAFGEFRLVEPEFALQLHADIPPGTGHTRDSVAAAVGGVWPCVEVVASAFLCLMASLFTVLI